EAMVVALGLLAPTPLCSREWEGRKRTAADTASACGHTGISAAYLAESSLNASLSSMTIQGPAPAGHRPLSSPNPPLLPAHVKGHIQWVKYKKMNWAWGSSPRQGAHPASKVQEDEVGPGDYCQGGPALAVPPQWRAGAPAQQGDCHSDADGALYGVRGVEAGGGDGEEREVSLAVSRMQAMAHSVEGRAQILG
ncbi:unnamed protein product, partial [Closterium sp. NIES-65]